MDLCLADHPTELLQCTLDLGHQGSHTAHGVGTEVLATWTPVPFDRPRIVSISLNTCARQAPPREGGFGQYLCTEPYGHEGDHRAKSLPFDEEDREHVDEDGLITLRTWAQA